MGKVGVFPPPPTQHQKSDSLGDRKMTNFRYCCSKVFHKLKAISCYTFISLRASSSPVLQQRDHTSARPQRTASHRAAQLATVRRQRGRALDSPTQAVPHTWRAPEADVTAHKEAGQWRVSRLPGHVLSCFLQVFMAQFR